MQWQEAVRECIDPIAMVTGVYLILFLHHVLTDARCSCPVVYSMTPVIYSDTRCFRPRSYSDKYVAAVGAGAREWQYDVIIMAHYSITIGINR